MKFSNVSFEIIVIKTFYSNFDWDNYDGSLITIKS